MAAPTMELWTHARTLPRLAGAAVRRAEDEGWTGVTLGDSQNMSGDPYVALGTAVAASRSILLSTGVTNPATRHPAVTASAILCAHVESGGRVELGVGRGDSALAHLGMAPVGVGDLREFLEIERMYLCETPIPVERVANGASKRIGTDLPLGHAPEESRMMWVDELRRLGVEVPSQRVPIWVAATGPRVISTAAELCDRVTFALGADPRRLEWAAGIARAARQEVALGAYVTVVVDDDRKRAFELSRGGIATMARFSAMHGRVHGPVSVEDEQVLKAVPEAYDMYRHARSGPQGDVVTPEFAERFAVIGPPGACAERLLELVELGITRFHVGGASRGEDPDLAEQVNRRFLDEVVPRLST